jgi:hypothetical protein
MRPTRALLECPRGPPPPRGRPTRSGLDFAREARGDGFEPRTEPVQSGGNVADAPLRFLRALPLGRGLVAGFRQIVGDGQRAIMTTAGRPSRRRPCAFRRSCRRSGRRDSGRPPSPSLQATRYLRSSVNFVDSVACADPPRALDPAQCSSHVLLRYRACLPRGLNFSPEIQ